MYILGPAHAKSQFCSGFAGSVPNGFTADFADGGTGLVHRQPQCQACRLGGAAYPYAAVKLEGALSLRNANLLENAPFVELKRVRAYRYSLIDTASHASLYSCLGDIGLSGSVLATSPLSAASYPKPPSDSPEVVSHDMFVTRSMMLYAYFTTNQLPVVTLRPMRHTAGASAYFTAAPSEDRKQLIENNLFSARGPTRPRPIADPGGDSGIIPEIPRPWHSVVFTSCIGCFQS